MPKEQQWDAVVIGSGMGGLSAAAALARTGRRTLVLEQHFLAGGLTQTFSREGFRWDVGVHYLGEVGPHGASHGILNWLVGDALQFASMGDIYDIVHFPDGFELPFPRGESALNQTLRERFPASAAQIEAFFSATVSAERAGRAAFAERAMPGVLARLHGLWHGGEIQKWWGRSSEDVLVELVEDPKLRAVLFAQSGDYGGVGASEISFGLQAMVMRHYFDGAYYPVGGAGSFAEALVPVIERAGGELRVKSQAREILIEDGMAKGVRLEGGEEIRAPAVLSAIGAPNSVHLLPTELQASDWAREILSFKPSVCHVALYLGLEGDIAAHGATRANHWYHDSWDIGAGAWNLGDRGSPPTTFVSFPSLKDPAHEPGPAQRQTAEVVAMADWAPFARWEGSVLGTRPPDYAEFKADIEARLMQEFATRFPELAPKIVAREVSTPLTNAAYIGSEHGAIYGIEVSPRRFLSRSLRVRTPVPRLILAGQDVVSPGIAGAMIGGVLAAAQLDMGILRHL